MKQNMTNSKRHTDEDRQTGHFTPDEVFSAINPGFLDEDIIRHWIVHRLHHAGARCPTCGAKIQPAQRQRWVALKSIVCRNCNYKFTATTGTFLAGCQLHPHEVFFLFLMIRCGLTNREIADHMHCSAETIRLWRQRALAAEQLQEAAGLTAPGRRNR